MRTVIGLAGAGILAVFAVAIVALILMIAGLILGPIFAYMLG